MHHLRGYILSKVRLKELEKKYLKKNNKYPTYVNSSKIKKI